MEPTQLSVDLLLRVIQRLADPDVVVLFATKDGDRLRAISCGDCGHSANNPNDIVHKSCCSSIGGPGCTSSHLP